MSHPGERRHYAYDHVQSFYVARHHCHQDHTGITGHQVNKWSIKSHKHRVTSWLLCVRLLLFSSAKGMKKKMNVDLWLVLMGALVWKPNSLDGLRCLSSLPPGVLLHDSVMMIPWLKHHNSRDYRCKRWMKPSLTLPFISISNGIRSSAFSRCIFWHTRTAVNLCQGHVLKRQGLST